MGNIRLSATCPRQLHVHENIHLLDLHHKYNDKLGYHVAHSIFYRFSLNCEKTFLDLSCVFLHLEFWFSDLLFLFLRAPTLHFIEEFMNLTSWLQSFCLGCPACPYVTLKRTYDKFTEW